VRDHAEGADTARHPYAFDCGLAPEQINIRMGDDISVPRCGSLRRPGHLGGAEGREVVGGAIDQALATWPDGVVLDYAMHCSLTLGLAGPGRPVSD
jgi:hypothetical protein